MIGHVFSLHPKSGSSVFECRVATADEVDGIGSGLSKTKNQHPHARPQKVSIPFAEPKTHRPQSSMEHEYYICSYENGIYVSDGRYGLVEPFGDHVGIIQHDGS